MHVPEADLDIIMRALTRTLNVDGVLVTMPHKHAVFNYCATSSECAKRLEVVNVIRRNSDGTWHGDMFDGLAFVKAQKDQGARLTGARVLLVGAGGAGSAIAVALLKEGVRELIIHDTDAGRTAILLRRLSGLSPARVIIGRPDPSGCELVCNASPMGMGSGDPLPVQPHLLSSEMFVGDVIAGHGETPLLLAAKTVGCKTANGVQMVEAARELMLAFLLGN
jgi:shikimate dehydrogenase